MMRKDVLIAPDISYIEEMVEFSKDPAFAADADTGEIIFMNMKAKNALTPFKNGEKVFINDIMSGFRADELINSSNITGHLHIAGKRETFTKADMCIRKVFSEGHEYLFLRAASKKIKDTLETELANMVHFEADILENADVWICVADQSRNIIKWNKAAENISGYTKEDVLGSLDILKTLFPFKSMRKKVTDFVTAHSGHNVSIRNMVAPIVSKDGQHKVISWNFRTVEFRGTGNYGFMFVGRNITKLRKTQKELNSTLRKLKISNDSLNFMNQNLEKKVEEETLKRLQQEAVLENQKKLAIIGDIIGSIAHQWRQPLNHIALLLQDMKDAKDFGELDDDYLNETIKDSMQEVSKMSGTIDDFRLFYAPSKEKTVFGLRKAVSEIVSMSSSKLKNSGIELRLKCNGTRVNLEQVSELLKNNRLHIEETGETITCDDDSVFGYRNELQQVVLNLINNSYDVLTEKEPEYKFIEIAVEYDMDNIAINVCDSGGGIPEEIINEVFEPYYTTKGPESGTGLGLYMARTLIEKHFNGSIVVTNNDCGACFTVKVPKS